MFFKSKRQDKQENNDKKNKSNNIEEQIIFEPEKKITIHIMPKRFLREVKTESNFLGIFIFILIFIAVGFFALYFFQDSIFPNGLPFFTHKNENENSAFKLNLNNSNSSTNQENNINTLNRNHNLNNSNINNSNSNINVNINNANTNTNTNSSLISMAPDRDKDTLTDAEEVLYKSNPNNPDTDGDGFLDGQEVANLYNPLTGSSELIENSGMTKNYINKVYNYSVIYPKSWQVVLMADKDRDVALVSSNKEFIEITIIDNPKGISAEQWYLKQIPANLAYKVEKIWANNFVGVKSLDAMHFYLTPISGKKNFIYSISYMVGSHMNITYPSTFKMIVRSFDISSNRQKN